MNHPSSLMLEDKTRMKLWERLVEVIETYIHSVDKFHVAPELNPHAIRSLLTPFDFNTPLPPLEALNFIVDALDRYQVHTSHPRYFGLFNPAPTAMGIVADTLTALFNPQLAAWSHSPFAVEVEQHLVRAFGSRFGYSPTSVQGTFTSGGAEANHTALLTALTHSFHEFATKGLRGLPSQPVFYVSSESHHSLLKAARMCGLGTDSVRMIPVTPNLTIDIALLRSSITKDRGEGYAPFMVVATAGTTSAGVVDPLPSIAEIASEENLWFHADAAWGGAAMLLPELRHVLLGIERADSIAFDAHKWLSVPMGAGLYLTRHDILKKAFGFVTGYMPRDAAGLDVVDPYAHSMQWSRRFIGLKVFLSLVVAGWDGYADVIRHQVAMGNLLRRKLMESGWVIVNETALPVICFVDGESDDGRSFSHLEAINRMIIDSGSAWISIANLGGNTPALRACITNYRTGPEDIGTLVETLNCVRQEVWKKTNM
jgi:glutamate/tyrosine decarboxylase-like PLP-dependent enzyme